MTIEQRIESKKAQIRDAREWVIEVREGQGLFSQTDLARARMYVKLLEHDLRKLRQEEKNAHNA